MRLFLSFCAIYCLALSNTITAQEEPTNRKLVIKLISNCNYTFDKQLEIDSYNTYYQLSTEKKNFEYGGISISVEFLKDKYFTHEFELIPLNIRNEYKSEMLQPFDSMYPDLLINGEKLTTIQTALRYQMNHYFMQNRKFQPYFGISALPYYNCYISRPLVSNRYENTKQNIGLRVGISPGFLIRFSDHLALNFDIPVTMAQVLVQFKTERNPIIPVRDQKTSKFSGYLFPTYFSCRTGLNYFF